MQVRASLAAICALLLTFFVTSGSGKSGSLHPMRESSPTGMAVSSAEFWPNYVAPNKLSERSNSGVTALVSQQEQANVVLTPADGPPGTVTTADGSGFTPNQPVRVTQSGGLVAAGGSLTIRADQFGLITISLRIPDQTPPGIISVTFTQGENAATAQFRVRRSSSGIGGALTQPIKGTVDEFAQWLNACVNGRLNIPMCTTGG
jgi:hypothetical protein